MQDWPAESQVAPGVQEEYADADGNAKKTAAATKRSPSIGKRKLTNAFLENAISLLSPMKN